MEDNIKLPGLEVSAVQEEYDGGPLPGMAEMYGVQPYMPDAPEIVHAGTPEVDFSLDAEGNLVVSAE